MKTILLFLLLPFFCASQDTLPAILKLQQGNYNTYVKGYVVLKDCKPVEYLRVNRWKRKERIRKFKKKVVDWRLVK